MRTNRALKLARWLPPAAALFALACALLAPAEAGSAHPSARRARAAQVREGVRERRDGGDESGSAVRGRVLYDDTERPARRARVMFIGEGGAHNEYAALTDARGEFRIPQVRAGRYIAFADVPGVLSPVGFISLGELRGGGPGMPDLGEGRAFFDIVEVDGKKDLTVTVRARRGATLSGRVTYSDGDPAVNVTVNLLRRDASGRLQKFMTGINIVSMSGLRTDDRGAYRLTGLPPGEYVVGVSEPVNHTSGPARGRPDDTSGMLESLTGQQLLMTFHPSSASVKEASVVKVAAGEERDDVDVRIPERELRAVAGVVLSRRERRPVAGARVTIVRRDDPVGEAEMTILTGLGESTLNGSTTDEEGRWRFTEIPDGPYTISVKPAEEYESDDAATNANMSVPAADRELPLGNMNGARYRRPRRKRGHAPARRDVEVAGDLSDVTIELGDGARVAGTVTTEDGEAVEYASVGLLRVPVGAAGDAARADAQSISVGVDEGGFSAEGLAAGRYFVQPGRYHDEPALYIKSVTWNGKDLTREPLELAEGASVAGVRIVYARGPASLRVKVVRGGEPALHVFVVLVPANVAEWSPHNWRQLTCSTGDEGRCVVKAPPGDYRVVAMPRKALREGFEAEVRRRAASAPLVGLRAGETKESEAVVPDR